MVKHSRILQSLEKLLLQILLKNKVSLLYFQCFLLESLEETQEVRYGCF